MLSLTVIDVMVPGDGVEFSQGGRRWYHLIHRTSELPEALVGGRERTDHDCFCRTCAARPDTTDAKTMEHYLDTFTDPEALRADFAFHRNLPRDATDNQALPASGLWLSTPAHAIAGGRTKGSGQAGEVEASMSRVATDVRKLIAGESGAFVPEGDPEFTTRIILEHVERCA